MKIEKNSENKSRWFEVLFLALVLTATGCGSDRDPASMPTEDKLGSVTRPPGFGDATAIYGPLLVKEGDFDTESPIKPWSSWWFPLREKYLFESEERGNSPLEKYDRYVKKAFDRENEAARYEKENLFDPNAGPWEGLCNAWAAASILAAEPSAPLTVHGITFGVGDQKAILVKSFERVRGLRQIGQRYNGNRGGVFEDIYPEQFHRVLQAELFEKGRPLIIDKDPGIAVWNTPIWKAQLQLRRDPKSPGVMHVTSWIFSVSPFVETYDYVGTLSVVLKYSYDLIGEDLPDGSMRVAYGEWTGESQDDHPDFVTVVPEGADHESANPEIQWQAVQEILSGKE